MPTPVPPTSAAPLTSPSRGGPAPTRTPGRELAFREALAGSRPSKPIGRADRPGRPGAGAATPRSEPPRGARDRRATLESPEAELQPFLPLPGIVRTVTLSPPPGMPRTPPERASELAALVDRAVESVRVGRSSEGHEARIRVRLLGTREPVEVRLLLRPDETLEARVVSETVDQSEARALAERLGRGLEARGLPDVKVAVLTA